MKTPTKKFGVAILNVTRGNVSIGLSTVGRSEEEKPIDLLFDTALKLSFFFPRLRWPRLVMN